SDEYEDELPFRTAANDPSVGQDNGDGIKSVTFQCFGPDGQEVYNHPENNPLYCAFGGGDDGEHCTRWRFSEHNNQWPNGKPAQPGAHYLIITILATRGGVARDERHFRLNLIQSEPQSLVAAISPTDATFGDELAFQ